MLEKKDIIKTLQDNREKLKKIYHIRRMGLIGSFSRNEQTEKSDIDFVIELDSDTVDIYETKKKLRDYLSHLFLRQVDLASYKYLKPFIKQKILNEAETIVE